MQELGRKKAVLSKKSMKKINKDSIDQLTDTLKTLQKYRNRIALIPEGLKTVGTGIYTQKIMIILMHPKRSK